MIKIFFYPECEFRQNRQLIFDYKIPYDLVAAGGDLTEGNLTFSRWYAIIKIVRTHFRPPLAAKDIPPQK